MVRSIVHLFCIYNAYKYRESFGYYGVLLLGGHFDVVKLLVSAGADVDSQDNRKVFCLMAAFRKVSQCE